MAKQVILTQNNFGIPIELQFVSNANSPVDLTDKTVEVAISYNGIIIDVLQATISSYTKGTAYIIVNTKHTSNVGLYTTFWSVRDEYGYITAQSDLYYYVKEEYNGAENDGIEQDKENSDISAIVTELETKINVNQSSISIINNNITNLTDRITTLENSGGNSSSGTGLTEEQANNIEKIPSIEGTVASNSQAIANKADKNHEHTEYLKEIPDEYVTDTELSSKGYATETFVTNKIAEASLSGGDVDLSGYATKDDIPTKTSELTNDSGFITTIPDIYALKTDANKLNCVTIENVSLKEYILTNVTKKEKTYYFIAKTTCFDLPKTSNFYITVETPGMYTYKVTAKELNDSNGIYVCTYRTISSSWTKWEKVCTTTVADVGKTLITISDETNYKNSSGSESFYVVRNGICYVTLVIDCVSPSSNIEIATLPKAYGGIFRFSMGKENTAMDGYVLQEGSLKLSGGTADTKYYVGSFSYPVAES